MTEPARHGVARRTVVVGVLAAVLPVAGCGIRLEDDAPEVPLLPTRTPVPAEAELVALTRGTEHLAQLAATVPGALAADLAELHRRQHTVLRSSLVSAGVPAKLLDAGPMPSVTTSGTPPAGDATSSPAGDRVALAAAEASSASTAATFAGVGADLHATVAALHAQRYAAASLLTGRPPTVALDVVGGPPVAALATATAAAAYLLEVVAARSTGAQETRARSTLAALRALQVDQEAGGARADAALGHPLPFPVEDLADAARLARSSLTALRAGYGAYLGPLVAADPGAGLAAATRWLGTVEVEAHRWGVELVPFPGLA